MKPLPSLSQSTNSSLALPMTSAWGLDAVSLELGEARGLRARPGLGLPWGTLRSLGLTGTASALPWPTSTSPSLSHMDITAQGGELVPFRKETSIFSNVFRDCRIDRMLCPEWCCEMATLRVFGASEAVSVHAIYSCCDPVVKHWVRLHNSFLKALWWNYNKPFSLGATHPHHYLLGCKLK